MTTKTEQGCLSTWKWKRMGLCVGTERRSGSRRPSAFSDSTSSSNGGEGRGSGSSTKNRPLRWVEYVFFILSTLVDLDSSNIASALRSTRIKQVFFWHLQGGYGRHLASDRLSFSAKNLSFLGENLVFFMFSVIKIWPCLRSAEFKSNFFEFFWLLSLRKSAEKNPLPYVWARQRWHDWV